MRFWDPSDPETAAADAEPWRGPLSGAMRPIRACLSVGSGRLACEAVQGLDLEVYAADTRAYRLAGA